MDLPIEAEDYNVIPVRTWVSGSPYKVKKSAQDFDSNQPTYNEGSTFEGGLENYFFGDELPKEGEVEDDKDAEDLYKDAYDETNEGEEDDEEYYEEEYEEGADNEDEEDNEYEQDGDQVQEQEEEEDDAAVMESYQRLFPDEDGHVTPELSQHLTHETKSVASDYLNAYQELMQYMSSPQKIAGKIQANLYVPQSGVSGDRQKSAGDDEGGGSDGSEGSGYDDDLIAAEFEYVVKKSAPKKQTSSKKKTPSYVLKGGAKKLKKVKGGPGGAQQGGEGRGSNKKLLEIAEKHKVLLAEMSNKRKQEEEELLRQVEQAQEKRKRFKEALLEKALKARKEQQDHPQQPQAPSAHKPSAHPGTTAQAVQHEDTVQHQREEERREYIASVRRKFKEQHKQLLLSLMQKRKDKDTLGEEEVLREEMRKLKRKKKILLLLEKKREGEEDGEMRVQSAEELGDGGGEYKGSSKVAVGSALAVIRQRGGGGSGAAVGVGASKKKAAVNNNEEELVDEEDVGEAGDDAGGPEASNHLKQLYKQQKQKIADYLKHLTDQKKREETEKSKKEERQKRRAQILAQRLIAEAQERKSMNAQDKEKYQATPGAGVGVDTGAGAGGKKITAEMAGAMAERLQMKSHRHTDAAPPSPPHPAPKRIARAESKAEGKASEGGGHKGGGESKETRMEAKEKEASAAPKPRKVITKGGGDSKKGGESKGDDASSSSDDDDEDAPFPNPTPVVRSSHAPPPPRDFTDWKRRNNCPQNAKVFTMTGWYPCVKQALLDRGWVFNPEPTSPYAHLKWTLRSCDVNANQLQDWQLTNHYMKNVIITTKAGLIKALQSLVWVGDVDAREIIPRAYDLSIREDMQAFLDDYRALHAEKVLRSVYAKVLKLCGGETGQGESAGGVSPPTSARPGSADEGGWGSIPPPPSIPESTLSSVTVNPVVYKAACSILECMLRPYEDAYLDAPTPALINPNDKVIGDLEWELVWGYDIHRPYSQPLSQPAPTPLDDFLFKDDGATGGASEKDKRRFLRFEEERRDAVKSSLKTAQPLSLSDLEHIHTLLYKMRKYYKGQGGLNAGCKGDGAAEGAGEVQNMWIVKPAAKSRGRGITTFNDIYKLLKYVEAGVGGSLQWIVQKYIENPLIIAKRKFDLRQWVLVTSWNPLTIYFYDECYARFSVEEYSTDKESMENCYVHLVNNSIGKNNENFSKPITAENGALIEGYMMDYKGVCDYMQWKAGGKDVMREKIHNKMKEIAKVSLMCAVDMIEHRKNSWELYGFDYMVDEDFNAWLIEINSSPACDYSTKVTECYVQKALIELLSVVLDVRDWEGENKKTRGDKPDTGGWECIYTGPLLELPVGAFGTDMSLKGEGVKVRGRGGGGVNVSTSTLSLAKENSINHPAMAQGGAGAAGGVSGKMASAAPKFTNTATKKLAPHPPTSIPTPTNLPARKAGRPASPPSPHSSPPQHGMGTFDDSDGDEESVGGKTRGRAGGDEGGRKMQFEDQPSKKVSGGGGGGGAGAKRRQSMGGGVAVKVVTIDFPGLL